eukprot:6177357-Pleurochrysis_carterae.AAC.1
MHATRKWLGELHQNSVLASGLALCSVSPGAGATLEPKAEAELVEARLTVRSTQTNRRETEWRIASATLSGGHRKRWAESEGRERVRISYPCVRALACVYFACVRATVRMSEQWYANSHSACAPRQRLLKSHVNCRRASAC